MIKNVVYPVSAKEAGIQGKVLVKTIIDEKGNVVETEVIKELMQIAIKPQWMQLRKLNSLPALKTTNL